MGPSLLADWRLASVPAAARPTPWPRPTATMIPRIPPSCFPSQGAIEITDPALFRWGDTYWVFSSGAGIAVHSSKTW